MAIVATVDRDELVARAPGAVPTKADEIELAWITKHGFRFPTNRNL